MKETKKIQLVLAAAVIVIFAIVIMILPNYFKAEQMKQENNQLKSEVTLLKKKAKELEGNTQETVEKKEETINKSDLYYVETQSDNLKKVMKDFTMLFYSTENYEVQNKREKLPEFFSKDVRTKEIVPFIHLKSEASKDDVVFTFAPKSVRTYIDFKASTSSAETVSYIQLKGRQGDGKPYPLLMVQYTKWQLESDGNWKIIEFKYTQQTELPLSELYEN